MLSLFDSFVVPDLPHIQIYRDDEHRHKFYMITEHATIARDEEGKPLCTFILYARDVDKLAPEDREVERGYLALTTQAGVSPQEEQKVRDYLRQKLIEEQTGRYWFLNLMITQTEPELGYPPLWLDGTVEFRVLGPDMVPFSAGSKEPSLVNTNVASFSATLSQDGAELFRQAVEKGTVPAGIWYNLTFAARIPAIKITIDGDATEFEKEVRNYVRRRYEHVSTRSFLGITYARSSWVSEWDELSSIDKFRGNFHGLTIKVDDSSLPDGDKNEMKDKLETMAFEIFQTNILPGFFEPALREVAKEKEGTNTPPPGSGVPVNETATKSLHVEISRSEIVKKKINPNAQLGQALTADEVKAHTMYIDLGQPYFQELDVSVNANVNFMADPVFALKVFLDYDQQDDPRGVPVKKAKELLFRSADMVGRFRQVMAKSADGAPKDSYHYWSEISYKDTGETIRIPRTGALESRERQLVISYRRLGFVKVNLMLGTMPDSVRSVEVAMRYPGYSGPSGQQSFELTKAKPTAIFFTYTGQDGDPGDYKYKISYVMADGQRMDLTEQDGQSDTLTIRDPFEQTATARFLAQADFSVVQKIIVDAHYQDKEHDLTSDTHVEFSKNGESSAWTFGLRDPNKLDFDYTVTILYTNGSRRELTPKHGQLGQTIAVGEGAVDALDITVIASTLDWSKYKLVLVYLEYSDPAKHYEPSEQRPADSVFQQKNFTFRPENADTDQTWHVLLRNANQKAFFFRVRYIGVNTSDNREIGWTRADDPILVLE